MKKNVASQTVGAEMLSATDGSAFTGAVTVHITIDGGTQATGSVGSGAATHEGNGYHSYAPSQAETNGDHIAFTFTGSGAIPVTVQVYTTFPQTGDNYSRLGSPTGASVSADIAAVKGQVADIETDTQDLQTQVGTDGAGLTAIPWNAAWDAEVQSEAADALNAYDPPTNAEMEARTLEAASYATAANQDTIAGYIDTEIATLVENVASILADTGTTLNDKIDIIDGIVDSILVDTSTSIPAVIDALNNLSQADIRTAVGLASANLDTQIAALPTAAENREEMDSNSTQLAAIVADTNELQSDDIPGKIAALNDFDPASDTVSLAAGGITASVIADGAIDAAALSDDAAEEIRDKVLAGTVTELSSLPGASPTLIQALALIYMAIRNKRDTTASSDEIHNDGGTAVFERTLSDDGTTFSAGKLSEAS